MTERKQILLRLDPAVYEALARWASDELRSANAQIEFLLRRSLAEAGRLPGNAKPIPRRGRPRKPVADGTPPEASPGPEAAGTAPGTPGAPAPAPAPAPVPPHGTAGEPPRAEPPAPGPAPASGGGPGQPAADRRPGPRRES